MTDLFKTTRFPTIFSSSLMNDMFKDLGKWEDAFTSAPYPYDVKQLKNGTIIIEFALAGWDKSEIKINIIGDDHTIEATKASKEKDKSQDDVTYLHKGLAKRNLKYSFKLGTLADKKKINSSFENGLLTMTLPISKEETYSINVD
jgi:molecular chaperone IbpA